MGQWVRSLDSTDMGRILVVLGDWSKVTWRHGLEGARCEGCGALGLEYVRLEDVGPLGK